jgi:hypothetical protein
MLNKITLAVLMANFCLATVATGSQASDLSSSVRDHRTKEVIRDHRIPRKNEVVPITREKLDCRVGAAQLLKMGYVSIVPYDCDGPVYHYNAMDKASLFRAAMSAYTGKIEVVFIGIVSE